MSMTFAIHPESETLSVSVTGEFSLEEAKKTFLEVLEAASRHKTAKILIDGRTLTGEPDVIERFYYGKFTAEAVQKHVARGAGCAPRFAYVLKIPVLDPKRFGEIVAVNRGMLVKVFDNPEDALGWLASAPAGEQMLPSASSRA